jgi:hypothetical protein
MMPKLPEPDGFIEVEELTSWHQRRAFFLETVRAIQEEAYKAGMAAERERCVKWLLWFDGGGMRRTEAISNGDHWESPSSVSPEVK